jgi:hypothetical protein
MTRRDLVSFKSWLAATYRREAKARRTKNPRLAAELEVWANASEARAEKMRSGPLFGVGADHSPVGEREAA